jgi:hypothetical protein
LTEDIISVPGVLRPPPLKETNNVSEVTHDPTLLTNIISLDSIL